MGRGAVKKRQEEARARRRNAANPSEPPAPVELGDSPATTPLDVATASEAEAEGEANTAPITRKAPIARARGGKAKGVTATRAGTRSRVTSGTTAPARDDPSANDQAEQAPAKALVAIHPTRKAAGGIKAVIDRIKLNELTEESNDEGNFEETADSTGPDSCEDQPMEVSDDSEEEKIVVDVPKKVSKKPAGRAGKPLTKATKAKEAKLQATLSEPAESDDDQGV